MFTRAYSKAHMFNISVYKGIQWGLYKATNSDAYIHKGGR